MSDTAVATIAAGLEAEQIIRSLYQERRVTAKLVVPSWTAAAYRQAIEQSSLKSPVKRTLHAMVDNAAGDRTTIDRATLCLLTGIKEESTITEHFRKARAAGLLESQRRFKNSSIHTLLIPGIGGLAGNVQLGRPPKWHSWTVDEITWWDSLDPEHLTAPPWHPWQSDKPPF